MHTGLQFSHQLVKSRVQPGDTAIDATAGNGHDTLFLAQQVGPKGTVLSYDIQESAINSTRRRLSEADLLSRVRLIHRGHETMETELAPDRYIKAVMFNTGYLPGGDHTIITEAPRTLQALTAACHYLLPKGIITIVAYHGHPGGKEELANLVQYLQQLDQQEFDVLQYGFINQHNEPPLLFAVEKKLRKAAVPNP